MKDLFEVRDIIIKGIYVFCFEDENDENCIVFGYLNCSNKKVGERCIRFPGNVTTAETKKEYSKVRSVLGTSKEKLRICIECEKTSYTRSYENLKVKGVFFKDVLVAICTPSNYRYIGIDPFKNEIEIILSLKDYKDELVSKLIEEMEKLRDYEDLEKEEAYTKTIERLTGKIMYENEYSYVTESYQKNVQKNYDVRIEKIYNTLLELYNYS